MQPVPRSFHAQARAVASSCLAARARRLDRLLARVYDGALRPHGVTGAQLGLLVAIGLSGPTSAAKVGRLLELEKSTLSRNLKRLMAAGLVEATDGLRVTERGAATVRACHPAWQAAQRQARTLLGKHAVELLQTLGGPTSPITSTRES
jgi:DNA-binding MarR family transcriptional regulator